MPNNKQLRPRGRPRRYDWDALFRKGRFILRRPKDYKCRDKSMAQQARNAVSARRTQGLSAVVLIGDGFIEVVVQNPMILAAGG